MVVREMQRNTDGVDYFVGDIHGHFNKLKDALSSVNFNFNKDRLFSVGDIIDRGVNNEKCLQLVNEPWFHMVMGNHEELAYDTVFNDCKVSESIWYGNGGEWWRNLNPLEKEKLKPLINKFKDLPHIIIVDNIAVVHAELFGDISDYYGNLRVTKLEQMKWGRRRLAGNFEDHVKGVEMVVVGHSPVVFPTVLGNTVYIDNGFWYSGKELKIYTAKELREVLKNGKEVNFIKPSEV